MGLVVGSSEGAVGSVVGCSEGSAVGALEGSAVGASEGSAEGSAEGSKEGSAEGSKEGSVVIGKLFDIVVASSSFGSSCIVNLAGSVITTPPTTSVLVCFI